VKESYEVGGFRILVVRKLWKVMKDERTGQVDPLYRKVMEKEDWWILIVKKSLRRGLVDLLCRKVMEEEDQWIFCVGDGRRGLVDLLCRKVMSEEDWRIFCAVKSWRKRTGGSSV
jgi:hypothetical protein